jgi:hypothetical protein
MLVQDLPKVNNRFHSQQLETHITVEYPQGDCVMSGVKTQISLEHRRNGQPLTVDILSMQPLRPHQLRAAINQALGDHWQYKQLALSCHNYEF